MIRETTPEEIDALAQCFHQHPRISEYPTCFLDLQPGPKAHLRRIAYLYLTGDFDFKCPLADAYKPKETPDR